jgi:hypothetical protein
METDNPYYFRRHTEISTSVTFRICKTQQDDSCTALRAAVPHGARHAAMGHRRGVGCYAAFPTAVDGVVTLLSQPFIIATVTWQENANFGQSTQRVSPEVRA